MKLLLVEDDPDLAVAMRRLLVKENHVVDVAESLRVAKAALQGNTYDVVLLDRRLPDGEGTDLIRFARRLRRHTRFLIISALGNISKRVEGLDLGADDYVVKPFDPEELLARIRAAARRPLPEPSKVVTVGNMHWHSQHRHFTVGGKEVLLTRREMLLLEKLMKHAGTVVTHDRLEDVMYGYDDFVLSNTLQSHISRLRRRLVDCGAEMRIHTVRGVGYLLRATAEEAKTP